MSLPQGREYRWSSEARGRLEIIHILLNNVNEICIRKYYSLLKIEFNIRIMETIINILSQKTQCEWWLIW